MPILDRSYRLVFKVLVFDDQSGQHVEREALNTAVWASGLPQQQVQQLLDSGVLLNIFTRVILIRHRVDVLTGEITYQGEKTRTSSIVIIDEYGREWEVDSAAETSITEQREQLLELQTRRTT